MALRIAPIGNDQFFDANGKPAVGYKLFTYAEGTTTKFDVFTDIGGTAKHTNPIILNAMGFPPSPLFLDIVRRYKFVLTGPDDTDPPQSALYTWDGISAGVQVDIGASAEYVLGGTPAFISGTSFSVPGDQTLILTTGRRVKLVSGAGEHFGTISTATFGAGVTTVTIIPDTSVLDPSITVFFYGFLGSVGGSVPDCFFDGLETNFVGPVTMPPADVFNLIPASFLTEYAGSVAPPGYAFCFGQSLVRSEYPGLFAAIGTDFGSVDGSHFNLPDLRGCFPLGKDDMGGVAAGRVTSASKDGANAIVLGGRGGEQVTPLTIATMPAHDHAMNLVSGTGDGGTSSGPGAPGPLRTGMTGGDAAHNTMPPWLCLNYIVRLY